MAATNAMYAVSYSPGNAQGYLEDVKRGALALVDPADAPVFKKCPHRPVNQLRTDWVTDALAAVTSLPTPSAFDADPTTSGTDDRARPVNYVQWFWKAYKTAQVSQIIAGKGYAAGVPNEVKRQINNKTKELLKEMELVLLSEQTGAADNDTNGAKMDGFFKAVSTNMTDTGDTTTMSSYIDETGFRTKVAAVYNSGGEGDLWCVAPVSFVASASMTFEGRSNTRETITRGEHKVDTVLSTYAAPVGGIVTLEPNRTMNGGADTSVALIHRGNLSIGVMQDVNIKDLSQGKVHPQGIVQAHITLDYDNEKVHGGWRNSNTLS